MRRLKFIHTLLLLVLALPAMATKPTDVVVQIDGKSYYKHIVTSGDTIYALSKAYNVSEQQILDCNEGLTPTTLRIDSYVFVPMMAKPDVKAKTAETVDKKKFIYHSVKSGDTVYSIARKYKISVATLERDNSDIDVERISPGMEVRVRRSERGYATMDDIDQEQRKRDGEVVLKSNEYRVMAGETVYSLSRRFGLSEEAFMEINSLKSARDLKEGMIVIRTKPAVTAQEVGVEPKTEVVAVESVVAEAPQQAVVSMESVAQHSVVVEVGETVVASEPTEVQGKRGAIVSQLFDGIAGLFRSNEEQTAEELGPEVTGVPMLRRVSEFETLYTVLMLPFHKEGKVNTAAVDLYRGVLLAMQDLSAEGYRVDLSVLDTQGSEEVVDAIVDFDPLFYGANLIIGPVYENEIRRVLPYAIEENIPLVSPLADITSLSSPVLFQMQSENDHKYDRYAEIFDGSRDIYIIHTSSVDAEYKKTIYELSTNCEVYELNYKYNRGSIFYLRNSDGSNGRQVSITDVLRNKKSKAFVVLANGETDVDRVLTTLSSTKSSILGRGGLMGDYVVVGNRRWKQMMSIDTQTFFNNNTLFLVPYHANRGHDAITMFDARYVEAYGVLPTMYSYRGYDAAMIFCRRMFEGFEDIASVEAPLTTPYTFSYENGLFVNTYWIMEKYKSDYTIEVE